MYEEQQTTTEPRSVGIYDAVETLVAFIGESRVEQAVARVQGWGGYLRGGTDDEQAADALVHLLATLSPDPSACENADLHSGRAEYEWFQALEEWTMV